MPRPSTLRSGSSSPRPTLPSSSRVSRRSPARMAHEPRSHAPEDDVLGDRQRRDEAQLLVDARDARLLSVSGAPELKEAAIDADLAPIGGDDPGQHLDQRALPGAVVPAETMDLAGRDVHRHAADGLDRAEAVREACDGKSRDHGIAAHAGASGTVIARLRILPVGPFGSSSTRQIRRGYLYAATRSLIHSRSSEQLHLRAGPEHDRCRDLLAEPCVRESDDGGFGDRRMLVEHLLDLARVDVEPAADDHVLQPPDDVDEPVLVHTAEVAREEPAVLGDRLLGGLLASPVALHDVVTADGDLPDLSDRELLAVLADDPHLDPRDRPADGSDPVAVARSIERRGGRGLRQPVASRAPPRRSRAGTPPSARAAAAPRPRRRCAASRSGSVLGDRRQRREHRRHPHQHRDAVAIDQVERPVLVEPGQERQPSADRDRRVERAGLAEGVVEREHAEEDVGLGDREGPDHLPGVETQVPMRQLGPLRSPGGPRRVEDHRRLLGIDLDHGAIRLEAVQQLDAPRLADRNDLDGRVLHLLPRALGLMPGEQNPSP